MELQRWEHRYIYFGCPISLKTEKKAYWKMIDLERPFHDKIKALLRAILVSLLEN